MVQKIELYGGAGFYDDLSCQFDVVTWDMRSTATQVITPHGKTRLTVQSNMLLKGRKENLL